MRSVSLRRLIAIALTIAATASAVIAYRYHDFLATSGLTSATWAGSGFHGAPILQTRDALLRFETAQAKAAYARGPSSTEWRGYLIVAASGSYRFVVIADDRASVEIDRHEIAGSTKHLGAGRVELGRGLHRIGVRYEDDGGQQMMEVLWARSNGSPASIPPLLLVPELRSFNEVRERLILTWLMLAVPTFWSMVLVLAAAVGIRALVRHFTSVTGDWLVRVVVVVSAVTLTMGIWWGLPDFYGWAPDELGPLDVTDALTRRFTGGWATIYPPLHYAVLLAFTSPFHVLASGGLVDPGQLHVNTAIFIVQRLVSVIMALGTVGLVYAIGSAMSPRAGAFAAATVSVALPFAYYGKLANVDIPYVFWFTLSMLFYLRMHRSGSLSDSLLFVVAGAAAIGTKDQAYGFYALPAVVLILSAIRQKRSGGSLITPTPAVVATMAAVAVISLMVFDNVLLNTGGFVEHLRIITGPGSQNFRMYERTLGGQARMFRDALWQLGTAMTWPLFGVAVIASVAAWRARIATIRLLLLPLLSYYVTFIAVVGYHYDRFFIGMIVLLAVPVGWGLDRWVEYGRRYRGLRIAASCCLFAYAVARVAALDALMIFDSRYAAEQWLLQHAPPDAHIAAAGNYLPRGGTLFWTPIPQDRDVLASVAPQFVIVNAAFTRRWSPSSGPGRFYDALSGADSTYKMVFSYRTNLLWSPLRLEKRFRDVVDDPFSNLSKVNPLIEIYGR
jgi:hypothetical protein